MPNHRINIGECEFAGCTAPQHCRHLCLRHYMNLRRYGDPRGHPSRHGTRTEGFWRRVDKNGPISAHRPDLGPCWIWTRKPNPDGYGHTRWVSQKYILTHRLAWLLTYGWLPPRPLELDHLCRVRLCCNPHHLEVVTTQENINRGEVGRNMRKKTHCPHGHPYAGRNVIINANGARICRECTNARAREYQRKKRRERSTLRAL